ncbi:MAG: ANTAR domain-containing protein [Lachnospiraceae bacterium]|nr:ANTAR domain-containing protein [Lachnospiraceae bacterium]
MINIIVVFPKPEDGKAIKNLLVRNGFEVTAVCTSGAQVMTVVDGIEYGIVICGYKFNDMLYSQLYECLPANIEMLLIASRMKLHDCTEKDILSVEMPLKVYDLINTIEMVMQSINRKRKKLKGRPQKRNPKEQAVIDKAKKVLMERNNMSEEEAHRYIQKNSMDSGTNMVETAQMVLDIMH